MSKPAALYDDIHMSMRSGTLHLAVQGGITEEEKRQQFAHYLDADDAKTVDVTFFDDAMLPPSVIASLLRFRTAHPDKPIKITVFHRYLFSYLCRLGFPVRIVPRREHAPLQSRKVRALVLGGSAGSLDKLITIFQHTALVRYTCFCRAAHP